MNTTMTTMTTTRIVLAITTSKTTITMEGSLSYSLIRSRSGQYYSDFKRSGQGYSRYRGKNTRGRGRGFKASGRGGYSNTSMFYHQILHFLRMAQNSTHFSKVITVSHSTLHSIQYLAFWQILLEIS